MNQNINESNLCVYSDGLALASLQTIRNATVENSQGGKGPGGLVYGVYEAMLWPIPAILEWGWVDDVGLGKTRQIRCEGKQESRSLTGESVVGGVELAFGTETLCYFLSYWSPSH